MRIVVTGASRGIGRELARQYAARGDEVFAAVRDPSRVDRIASVHYGGCDVADDESVRAFARSVEGAIDVVINNAGVLGKMQSLEELDLGDVLRTFDVDALGAIRVSRAFLPHLRRGAAKKLVHVSTGMGSITDNTTGGAYAYRMAKAALNMASRSMAIDLRREGIVSVVINPGWVQTDMGGPNAPVPVAESVRAMIAKIDAVGPEESGQFLDFRGPNWPF